MVKTKYMNNAYIPNGNESFFLGRMKYIYIDVVIEQIKSCD
jgi:hypothetical protein